MELFGNEWFLLFLGTVERRLLYEKYICRRYSGFREKYIGK